MLNKLKQLNMTMILTLPATTITTQDLGKSIKQTHFFSKNGQASNNALGRDNLLLTWPVDTILIIKSTSFILFNFCLGFGNIT